MDKNSIAESLYRLLGFYKDHSGGMDSKKYEKAVDEAIKAVKAKPKWIPVIERLPEDRRTVLVTAYWHETYQVMEASYFGDGLWWCVPFNNTGNHEQKLNPKAWSELPEPYKGEQE